MNALSVGVARAWSTIRADAVQQALEIAVLKQQAKAGEAVVKMVDRAAGDGSPPPPDGQGREVDRRV
jgi:hypothetical protein